MKRLTISSALAASLAFGGASSAAGELRGTFTTRITGAPLAQLDGLWTMKIEAGGRYTIAFANHVLISGRATERAATIAFGHETGRAACRGAEATGVYRWRLARGRLTLTRVTDECAGRAIVLAHAFTKTA